MCKFETLDLEGNLVQRTRWVAPVVNPRRASLRYRCLYPMQELKRRGQNVGIWRDGEIIDATLTLVFDAWTLFTTTSSATTAEAVVELAISAKRQGVRIILDNCDNQFSNTTDSLDWRGGLDRLQQLGRIADVVVSCSYALSDAMQFHLSGNAKFIVIDDPIEERIQYPDDTLLKSLLSPRQKMAWLRALRHRAELMLDHVAGRTPLVWFGSHGNQFAPGGMSDIVPLLPVMERVAGSNPISLTIISNHRKKFDDIFQRCPIPTHYLEWDRITFLTVLKMHDISIIPSVDNAFTRCKSSNRLTLSIHHGLSVIADSIPSYQDYADVALLGNWEANLRALLSNAAARNLNLQSKQKNVRSRNSLSVIADCWSDLLFFGALAA